MNEIELFISQNLLLKNITKLKLSLSDIESKHPNRKDLIESMTESVNELYQVLHDYKRLEQLYNTQKGIYTDMTLKCLKNELKANSLEDELKGNKVNLDYICHLEKENKELNEKINMLISDL